MVEAPRRSAGERGPLRAIVLPFLLVDRLQLALDRARSAEQPSVHLIEALVGCVEHESARHADGNADGAPIELDRETLIGHYSSPGEQRHWRWHNGRPPCSSIE